MTPEQSHDDDAPSVRVGALKNEEKAFGGNDRWRLAGGNRSSLFPAPFTGRWTSAPTTAEC
jgi:hypothetical protein